MQHAQARRNWDKKKPALILCRRSACRLPEKSGHEWFDRPPLKSPPGVKTRTNTSDLKNALEATGSRSIRHGRVVFIAMATRPN
ncbi:hypothetical protein [Caballeronia ptereochthonis]|uniref:hypothetical protein n=1 Tax=Caballeronia ptereochthonis TaxID=1777144 RepID=UPI001357EEB3|nr:hypothetical protein [Caballeronia ptereochthonis]